ncbi:RNA polymerase sigma factor [Tundrisphaera lichenicola]|uniref:RNA polymerase sigma factor n=1 Tax=Tundrisphaera lichenicola TaxID=2029860 RepID=UPI003EB6B5B8
MDGKDRGKIRRSYRPGVEALEALRHLSVGVETPMGLVVEQSTFAFPSVPVVPTIPDQAWDAALNSSRVADLLSTEADLAPIDQADVSAGLRQMDRYLSRAWFRAGISVQQHDDCTQAVYATLLQGMGRDRFDRLLSEVGQSGIREVLSRETADGPDFFRAIDTIKKRAQRERTFQTLDAASLYRADNSRPSDWQSTLQEAIRSALNPREAALIQATLQGETPAEIAQHWGIAPKTVSNEKTRALQKLRDALVSDLLD